MAEAFEDGRSYERLVEAQNEWYKLTLMPDVPEPTQTDGDPDSRNVKNHGSRRKTKEGSGSKTARSTNEFSHDQQNPRPADSLHPLHRLHLYPERGQNASTSGSTL